MKLQCPKCGGFNLKHRGQARGAVRFKCGSQNRNKPPVGGCGWHGTDPIGLSDYKSLGVPRGSARSIHRDLKEARGIKRYVVTAAQNATAVNERFLGSLLSYCKHRRAQLIVIPYRYKNPTSMWSDSAKGDDWWDSKIVKYLMDIRTVLNKNLMLLADIKTQPTAHRPLEGFETISSDRSAIIGHPKLEMMTVATPQNRLPKILITTGAVTNKNYIPSKAGKRAEFHHTFGAAVVELSGSLFHIRQINAVNDGSFCELAYEYHHDTPPKKVRADGLVMGDTHVEFVDPQVVSATWGPGSITEVMKPKEMVWHDVHDNYAPNFHHRNELVIRHVKHHLKLNNVRAELERTFAFIDAHTAPDAKNIFPFSNHPGWLAQWVKTNRSPGDDLENLVFWAQSLEAMLKGSVMTTNGVKEIDPFVYWAERWLKSFPQATFLSPDDSYRINGIEVGMHGHLGPNGSDGSIGAFGKVGVKSIIGHSHSPGIRDGVYQVGTSSRLKLDYNKGPSSWLNTHCLVYPNGKRTLINIIDGHWRA